MQVTVTAGMVQAVCAVAALVGGFALWAVQMIVAREIRKLNGRYVYADDSKITGREIQFRLEQCEAHIGRRGK